MFVTVANVVNPTSPFARVPSIAMVGAACATARFVTVVVIVNDDPLVMAWFAVRVRTPPDRVQLALEATELEVKLAWSPTESN